MTQRTTLIAVLITLLTACSETQSNAQESATGDDQAGAGGGSTDSEQDDDVAGSQADTSAVEDVQADSASGVVNCGDREVVTFQTADEITLTADLLPAETADRPAVVLLHQIPPHFDRTSYPERVLNSIAALNVTVLNLDRRGAGDSPWDTPVDAYEGPGGLLDVEAAVRFLIDSERPCAIDRDALTLIGASNGTTSVLDYTLAHAEDLPDTAKLIWLSPGTYTENQQPLADHRELLNALPILWIFPDSEPWSLDFGESAPDIWRFVEIEGGGHGTANFDDGALEEQQLGEILGWIAQ